MYDKELIKTRFKKSLETYENEAVVQKSTAEYLTKKILETSNSRFDAVLELGSGTGFLTKNLAKNIKFSGYFANDIINESQNYVKKYVHNAVFINQDIETLELDKKFDLIASNAVVQWIFDFDMFLFKMKNLLTQNGLLAFCTFGEQNLREIKEITGLSLDYTETKTLKKMCSKHFKIEYFEEQNIKLLFDTPKDVLKHLKLTGTNALKPLKWTRSDLARFEKVYFEKFSRNSKVTLTYNPLYFILISR